MNRLRALLESFGVEWSLRMTVVGWVGAFVAVYLLIYLALGEVAKAVAA